MEITTKVTCDECEQDAGSAYCHKHLDKLLDEAYQSGKKEGYDEGYQEGLDNQPKD